MPIDPIGIIGSIAIWLAGEVIAATNPQVKTADPPPDPPAVEQSVDTEVPEPPKVEPVRVPREEIIEP